MCLVYSFDMLSMGDCTTSRHWPTSGRLVQELNDCTVLVAYMLCNRRAVVAPLSLKGEIIALQLHNSCAMIVRLYVDVVIALDSRKIACNYLQLP